MEIDMTLVFFSDLGLNPTAFPFPVVRALNLPPPLNLHACTHHPRMAI